VIPESWNDGSEAGGPEALAGARASLALAALAVLCCALAPAAAFRLARPKSYLM